MVQERGGGPLGPKHRAPDRSDREPIVPQPGLIGGNMPWWEIGGKIASGIGGIFGLGRSIKESITGPRGPYDNPEKAKRYMDTVFPGTTPWERLGSAGGGATVGAGGSAAAASEGSRATRQAARTAAQQQDMNNRRMVMLQARGQEIQAVSHIVAEMAKDNPTSVDGALNLLNQATGKNYATGSIRASLGGEQPWDMVAPGYYSDNKRLTDARVSQMGTQETEATGELKLKELRLQLDQWVAENGRSYLANEMRGVLGLLDDPQTKSRIDRQLSRLRRFDGMGAVAAVIVGALGVGKLSSGARRLIRRVLSQSGRPTRVRRGTRRGRDPDQPPPPVDMDRHEWDSPERFPKHLSLIHI